MPEYTKKDHLQEAIKWIALAEKADTLRDAWRRYNTARSIASEAGANITTSHGHPNWPPCNLARNFLAFALKCLEQEETNP